MRCAERTRLGLAQCERANTSGNQEGVEGRKHAAEALHDEVADRSDPLAAASHQSADGVAVTPERLGQRVHDEIGA